MADLPIHPLSGVQAIAVTPTGRPVWPIRGGSGDDDEPDDKPGSGKADDEEGKKPDKGTPDWEAEAAKWKALARKHEGQAKTNSTAAQRLKELEDADKSEIEKAKEASAAEKARADAAEGRALRFEIAAEKGLTPAMVKRLVGSTREELESDADELLEALRGKGDGGEPKKGDGDKPRGPLQRPKEKLRSGSVPESEDSEEIDQKKANEIAEGLAKAPGF